MNLGGNVAKSDVVTCPECGAVLVVTERKDAARKDPLRGVWLVASYRILAKKICRNCGYQTEEKER